MNNKKKILSNTLALLFLMFSQTTNCMINKKVKHIKNFMIGELVAIKADNNQTDLGVVQEKINPFLFVRKPLDNSLPKKYTPSSLSKMAPVIKDYVLFKSYDNSIQFGKIKTIKEGTEPKEIKICISWNYDYSEKNLTWCNVKNIIAVMYEDMICGIKKSAPQIIILGRINIKNDKYIECLSLSIREEKLRNKTYKLDHIIDSSLLE